MKRPIAIALVVLLAACEKAPPPPKAPETAAEKTAAAAAAAVPAPPTEAILHPDAGKLAAAGPDSFSVHMVTSRGEFDLMVHRKWAPKGSDRLYYLVSNGFFEGVRFFRVLDGFMAQFGVSGDTTVSRVWRDLHLADDPVTQSNTRGRLTFATAGPNTRTTQLFINFGNNTQLDKAGFAPVGEVTNGMAVVDSLYNGYGEGNEGGGKGPAQGRLGMEGNPYLKKDFPKLDYIVTAKISQEWKKTK